MIKCDISRDQKEETKIKFIPKNKYLRKKIKNLECKFYGFYNKLRLFLLLVCLSLFLALPPSTLTCEYDFWVYFANASGATSVELYKRFFHLKPVFAFVSFRRRKYFNRSRERRKSLFMFQRKVL